MDGKIILIDKNTIKDLTELEISDNITSFRTEDLGSHLADIVRGIEIAFAFEIEEHIDSLEHYDYTIRYDNKGATIVVDNDEKDTLRLSYSEINDLEIEVFDV